MKYVILDIETVPFEIKHEDVKLYLMDKKISKERRSMDPNYAKIISIGIKISDSETKIFSGDKEKQILEEFWTFLKENIQDHIFITHNGYKFDIPFLLIRSVINKIPIPISINLNRWRMEDSNHFDTMLFFSQYEAFTNPNLVILAKMHGIDSIDTVTGSDIERLYKEKNWERIKEHCKHDINTLEQIFTKFCLDYLKSRQQNNKA